MKFRAVIPALLLLAACTENGAGVFGPVKCVDVPASSDVPTWILDREESEPRALAGVWGSPSGDVFAVGSTVIIRLHDGVWSREQIPTTAGLDAIWGSSGKDVFAVGYHGLILHYDGRRWSRVASGTAHDLLGVWGSSSTDVYVVGGTPEVSGVILHYDGLRWTSMTVREVLNGVWGSSPDDVIAVGNHHFLVHGRR